MGHLGLLPQTTKGKFKSKGKTSKEIKQLLDDARLLQNSGVFSIVLECVKMSTAKQITQNLDIPTIGIGSSIHCDGQVLVTDDLLGLNVTNIKFVKKFLNLKKFINLDETDANNFYNTYDIVLWSDGVNNFHTEEIILKAYVYNS